MKVLVVGGGGREHALCWKIAQSPRLGSLLCAPGNAGTAALAVNMPVAATDLDGICALARRESVDLVVVGPDDALAGGLVDRLEADGIRAFGPTRAAARIESSKSFAKAFMRRWGIPTADSRAYTDTATAIDDLRHRAPPYVLKADGLALGKGVIITSDLEQAEQTVQAMLREQRFGAAGKTVLIEDHLTGKELTVLAFSDGRTVVPMLSARDHKRVFDRDQGPNTGGMGVIAPVIEPDPALQEVILTRILQPAVRGMAEAGCPFRGVLYAELMLTAEGPQIIEFNARFGDPEAQAILPLLETDLVDIAEAVIDGCLDRQPIRWSAGNACCVVLASGGYPGAYQTGYPIDGLNDLPEGCQVFHAGTRFDPDGRIVTAGGRVLGVTAVAANRAASITAAYAAADRITFQDRHLRRDIGQTGG